MSQYSQGWSNLPSGAVGQGGAPPPQPAPPASGQWWAFRSRFDQSCHVAPLNPAGATDTYDIRGPFASQAAAQAVADQMCGTAPTQPPVGGGAPPPPAGGGAPSVSTYWNVCYDAGGGGVGIVQRLADTASGAMGQVNGAKAAFGPYLGRQAAEQAVEADLLKCPGATVEAGGCNVTPLINCASLPKTLHQLGTPGTPDWCKGIDGTVKELGAIGNAVFKFIDDILNAKTRIDNIDEYLKTSGVAPVSNAILKLIRQVFCWLGPYLETLRQSVACVRTWLAAIFPNCNTDALFGLLVIRHFLLTLERIEWGTDAAVWVVATSGLAIDPLMTTLDYLIRYACPVELIDEAAIIEAYKYNNVDEETAKCVLRAHGKQWETMLPGIIARGDKPGWKEVIEYLRRFGVNGEAADQALRNLGVLDPTYRQVLSTIYDELPSIGDHLEWLRKNVFDDEYVKDFQLMEGFETRFWPKFGQQLRAKGMTKENASLHYAAHWINPSFGQQFEMVQRLRPGRVDPSLVFTRNDLLRTMQEMDVGVYFRERLERVSHPVPNLTLCLQMYQFGTVDDAEFVEMLKDLGFDDANASKILAAQVIKVRRLNASSGHGWTPSSLASAYAAGRLGADQVSAEMAYLGYGADASERLMRRAEIELAVSPIRRIQQQSIRSALSTQESAYRCGAITGEQLAGVYLNAGIPRNVAQIAVANVDSAVAVGLCSQQVLAFRNALLKGKATLDQIREMMLNSGIPLLRVEQYLKSWVLEAQLKGPSATAAQILRWVGTGLLDGDVAAQRLRILGWTNPDLTLLLAESSAKLVRYQQALQRQTAKSQQAAAKAALSLAREAENTAKRLRSQLRGIASIATLKSWVKEGLMDDATFLDYATARGYDLVDAERYLAEAHLKAAAAKKAPKSKSVPGVQGNGTAQENPPAQP